MTSPSKPPRTATQRSPIFLEGGKLDDWAREPTSAATGAILDSFHVDLSNGAVWLGDRRVLVLQAQWLLDLRKTLIDLLGHEGARAVMTRLGYAAGVRDAHLSIKQHPDFETAELITSGGVFHALQGTARAVRRRVELDLPSKHCYLEFEWRNSIEDEGREATHDHHLSESCWMEIGYSSGFLSTCIGGDIVVREIQCGAQGASECICVARFSHEWGDVSNDLKYLDPGYLSELATRRPTTRTESHQVLVSTSGETSAADSGRVLIGRSGTFDAVLQQVRRVGKTTATVLLLGESGVGKTALAMHIHESSERREMPFVEVNCAAIPESLLESELFGVEKGAFTGASASRSGRFEEANGGTLFLDEIGLLPPAAQGKLLRVLQNQKYERLGSNRTQQADVRLIAATNNDLATAVRAGSFRSDLFYRINVFPITVPPLRSRLGDLPLLIDHLVSTFCEKYRRTPIGLTPNAYRAMLHYDWPGNIRELENVIERAVILADDGEALDVRHLFTSDAQFRGIGLHWLDEQGKFVGRETDSTKTSKEPLAPEPTAWFEAAIQQPGHSLEQIEQAVVMATLRVYDGNLIKAAQHLGVTRAQIDYRIKKWGVDPRLLASS